MRPSHREALAWLSVILWAYRHGVVVDAAAEGSGSTAAAAAQQARARGECIPTSLDYSTFHCYDSNTSNNNDDDREDSSCLDRDDNCREWSERGECQHNPGFMLTHCARSCDACVNGHAGMPQVAPSDDNLRSVLERLEQTKTYLQRKVMINAGYLLSCTNRDPLCTHWATLGECEKNPVQMNSVCPAACRRC